MLDLFIPQVDQNKLHHNFIEITKDPQPYARELLKSWTDGFIDRDHKFVKEFQTTFNSSFWELYLFNVFKQYGFQIDFTKAMPDFVITNPYEVCVEAVISNNAFNSKPEYERKPDDKPQLDEIVRTATIRLANAICYKYNDKFKKTYSKLNYVQGKPFILAVAPFEQPYFWEQTNRSINHVLYGIKGYKFRNPNNKVYTEITECIDEPFIEKDNGSEIQLGFFANKQMEEISAVLFSNVATFGKVRALTKDKDPRQMLFIFSKFNTNGLHPIEGMLPKQQYHETLESGLHLYLNPFAKYPLPDDFIKSFPSWSYFDFEKKMPFGDSKDGELFNRMVNVINFV